MAERILGILASGGGSNFLAIHNAAKKNQLPFTRIGVVLSDNEDAGALQHARRLGIRAFYLGKLNNDQRNDMIADIFNTIGVELGIGAGYLKKVGGAVLRSYPNEILNIHPAPLPRFGGPGMHGENVHKAFIESGVAWSGPTVHIMNEEYDDGQILGHVQVPVKANDTPKSLAARVLPAEHNLYWRVIAQQLRRGDHLEQ